jgi:uncharacterized membrane protein HdeD (DUF308 family)
VTIKNTRPHYTIALTLTILGVILILISVAASLTSRPGASAWAITWPLGFSLVVASTFYYVAISMLAMRHHDSPLPKKTT